MRFLRIPVITVAGSASWRIPLGVQIIPGALLAVGSLFLPPSPRLLVAHGRNEEALMSLAKLRLRAPEEADTDPLLQVVISMLLIPFMSVADKRARFLTDRSARDAH